MSLCLVVADIEYLRDHMPPTVEPEYFEFLANLTTDEVTVYAVDEGKVVFPRWVWVLSFTHINSLPNPDIYLFIIFVFDSCILSYSLHLLSVCVCILPVSGTVGVIMMMMLVTAEVFFAEYRCWCWKDLSL